MEKIICAFYGYAPNFSQPFAVAKDHGDASTNLISFRDEFEWIASDTPEVSGFVAGDESNFRYVNRREAYGIAEAAGQLNELGRKRESRVLQSCDIDFTPDDVYESVFNKAVEVARSFNKKAFAVMASNESSSLTPVKEAKKDLLFKNIRNAKHVFVYGGAFDPVTVGHKAIIHEIFDRMIEYGNKHFPPIDLGRPFPVALILMVSDNDEKKYAVSADSRKRMLRRTVESLCGSEDRWAEDIVQIVKQPVRTYRFLTETLELEPEKVTICMGADEWRLLHDFHQWEHSDELLARFSFMVFERNDNPLYDKMISRPNDDVDKRLSIVKARIPATSSTRARSGLNNDPMYAGADIPCEVLEYIVYAGLYGQVTQEDYDAAEKEAIARANPDDHPSFSVTATTMMISYGSVLLVRRKYGPYMGYWCFPGGYAEPGEDIEVAALREVKEETGIDIGIIPSDVKCIGVYTPVDPRANIKEGHGAYDVGLAVQIPHIISPKAGDDAKDARWVSLEVARGMKLAFHHNRILDDFLKRYPKGMPGNTGLIDLSSECQVIPV